MGEYYDRRVWGTRAEAKQAVACWIEGFYYRRRLYTRIGMVPPVEFEQARRAAGRLVVQEEGVLTLVA